MAAKKKAAAPAPAVAPAAPGELSPLDRAKAYLAQDTAEGLGQIKGVTKGYHGKYLVPGEVGAESAAKYRRLFAAQGYDHAPDCYVVGVNGAEVWTAPQAVKNLLDEAKHGRNAAAKRKLLKSWEQEAARVERIG